MPSKRQPPSQLQAPPACSRLLQLQIRPADGHVLSRSSLDNQPLEYVGWAVSSSCASIDPTSIRCISSLGFTGGITSDARLRLRRGVSLYFTDLASGRTKNSSPAKPSPPFCWHEGGLPIFHRHNKRWENHQRYRLPLAMGGLPAFHRPGTGGGSCHLSQRYIR